MKSFLPSTDAGLLAFSLNFSTLITAAPVDYGLTAPDATTITAKHAAYSAAYAAAVNPDTRTSVTIATKDAAKADLAVCIRGFAAMIKADTGVLDAKKLGLGLLLGGDGRTPVPAPLTFPMLAIPASGPLTHTIRFADSTTPDKRSKPEGVVALQLFCEVGSAAPTDPLECRFQRVVTKQPYQMQFGSADAGKTAFYYARWQTRTGLTGPWSQVKSMTVAA